MKKKNIEEFISKAREVHKDHYDYSKAVYCGALKKICVICPEHGEFWITPANHLSGQGCKICGLIERSKKRKKSIEQFIKESRTVHGDKYDYSKVKYHNIDKKVCIICPEHGEFWQTPYHHLNGCGCPKCSNVKHKTTNEFIKESRTVHGDKYDYSKVEYVNAHTKVCIICPEHGEFWQTPNKHLSGHKCPKCSESIIEKEIRVLLDKEGIKYVKEKRFNWMKTYRLDFYLPDYNIGIECQGIQHFTELKPYYKDFRLDKQLERDEDKFQLCLTNGVSILYFTLKSHFNFREISEIYNNNLYYDKYQLLEKIIRKKQLHL